MAKNPKLELISKYKEKTAIIRLINDIYEILKQVDGDKDWLKLVVNDIIDNLETR